MKISPRQFWIILFIIITNSFCIDQTQFLACQNVTEEKIINISKKEIMENFMQCMKDNNTYEKHQQRIEIIKKKIESCPENQFYIKMLSLTNLIICISITVFSIRELFNLFTKADNNNDFFDVIKLNLIVWGPVLSDEFIDKQINHLEIHEKAYKKAIANDIADIINNKI